MNHCHYLKVHFSFFFCFKSVTTVWSQLMSSRNYKVGFVRRLSISLSRAKHKNSFDGGWSSVSVLQLQI